MGGSGHPESPPPSLRLGLPPFQALLESAQPLAQKGDFLPELLGLARSLGVGLAARLPPRHHGGPAGPRGPFAKDAIHLPLAGGDVLEARPEGALQEVLPGLTVLDELVEEGSGQIAPVAPLRLQDDLREGDRGQILAGGRVDHGDLLPRPDHVLDLVEGHVAALLGVVELPVRVALDDVRHARASLRFAAADVARSLTPRVKADKGARATLAT